MTMSCIDRLQLDLTQCSAGECLVRILRFYCEDFDPNKEMICYMRKGGPFADIGPY